MGKIKAFLISSFLAKDTVHTCTGILKFTFRKKQEEDELVRVSVLLHHKGEAREYVHAHDDNKAKLLVRLEFFTSYFVPKQF